MTDDKLKINCAPLLERITICGASISDITSLLSNSLNKIEQIKTLTVKILEDYRSNLIPDSEKENQYVSHIPNFSFPDGLLLNSFHNLSDFPPKIFSFSLVNDNTVKHCTSLSFYENYQVKEKQFSLLKTITLVSTKEIYSTHKKILSFIYNIMLNFFVNKSKSKEKLLSVYSTEIKTSLYKYKLLEFYFSFLLNCLDISNSSLGGSRSFYIQDVYSIEEEPKDNFLQFYIDDSSPFPLKDFDVSMLLDHFDIEDLIMIYQSILMEYKIIFIFENYEDINLIIYSFLALIYPLKWKFPISSFILPQTEVMLDAPFAVVLGVPVKYQRMINFRLNKNLFSNETIVYDIKEKNFVFCGNKEQKFPVKIFNEIRSKLYFLKSERIKFQMFCEKKEDMTLERLEEIFSKNDEVTKMFEDKEFDKKKIDLTVYFSMKIISIFFTGLMKIISGFDKFIIQKDDIDLKECEIGKILDIEGFNESISKDKVQLINEHFCAFFKNFTRGLMFSNFVRSFLRKKNLKSEYIMAKEILNGLEEKINRKELKELINQSIKNKLKKYYKFRYIYLSEVLEKYAKALGKNSITSSTAVKDYILWRPLQQYKIANFSEMCESIERKLSTEAQGRHSQLFEELTNELGISFNGVHHKKASSFFNESELLGSSSKLDLPLQLSEPKFLQKKNMNLTISELNQDSAPATKAFAKTPSDRNEFFAQQSEEKLFRKKNCNGFSQNSTPNNKALAKSSSEWNEVFKIKGTGNLKKHNGDEECDYLSDCD